MNSSTAFFVGFMLTALIFIDVPGNDALMLSVIGGIILAILEMDVHTSGETAK